MTPEATAAYLAESQVLQRINLAISDAVRVQAANPLLHMAEYLRQPPVRTIAQSPAPSLSLPPKPAATGAASTPAAAPAALDSEKLQAPTAAALVAAPTTTRSGVLRSPKWVVHVSGLRRK